MGNGLTNINVKNVLQSIKKGKGQEPIQSNSTSQPENQKGKKHTLKLINAHARHAE